MKKIFKFLISFVFFALSEAVFFAADRPIVTEINAYGNQGSFITVSWKLPKNPEPRVTKLFVYKSSVPISNFTEISNATPAAELDSRQTGWLDKVSDYNDYYYAVICQTENSLFDIILPSINATMNGTHLQIKSSKTTKEQTESAREKLVPAGTMRETPLPYLDLTEGESRKQIKMSSKAKSKAKSLGGSNYKKNLTILEPHFFEQDLVSPDGGDEYLLFDILKDSMIQRDYKKAEAQLNQLLGTNRSKDVTDRAIFYLGECYYFQEKYDLAVKQFSIVYTSFPGIAKKWIANSLDHFEL